MERRGIHWPMPKRGVRVSKVVSVVCVFVLLALVGAAQQTTPADQASLVRLAGQLLVAGKAYEYDRQLADEIGPRLTGSPNYVKATDWAVAEFNRLGLANVHKEAWEIPAAWEPETVATGRM